MIFGLLKLVVWMAGVLTVTYFVLPYFGYEVNMNYFQERKDVCKETIDQCQKDLIKNGVNGAKESCNFKCVDSKLLIQKKDQE